MRVLMLVVCFSFPASCVAQRLDGLDLDDSSFADVVLEYDPLFGGGPAPTDSRALDPDIALGGPTPSWVSLGNGGLIELGFTDNLLTTSGDDNADLYVGEVNGTPEQFRLAIRPTRSSAIQLDGELDPTGYFDLGLYVGERMNNHIVTTIDLDPFFPDFALQFDAIRISDDPDEGVNDVNRSRTVGMDLTSVGALSSRLILNRDLNADSQLDASDINLLTAATRSLEVDLRFDLDNNGAVDLHDRTIWIEQIRNTFFGDSNLDGEFNSADFVTVFQAGEYEDDVPLNSTWETGDWNGDGDFSSRDFVTAFQSNGYENGVRPVASVPEAKGSLLMMLGIGFAVKLRRR